MLLLLIYYFDLSPNLTNVYNHNACYIQVAWLKKKKKKEVVQLRIPF